MQSAMHLFHRYFIGHSCCLLSTNSSNVLGLYSAGNFLPLSWASIAGRHDNKGIVSIKVT
jgi:hypothetical protein